MGRTAGPWKLEWRRGVGYVRFTHNKKPFLVSTGSRDPIGASTEAARIYARIVGGGRARPDKPVRAVVLVELFSEWLATLEGSLDELTIKTYRVTYVGKHWPAHYRTLGDMVNDRERERYRLARLRVATASTVRREVWIQDKFLRWCADERLISEPPKRLRWHKELGTRTGHQREKARRLTIAQVSAFLSHLPYFREVGPRAFDHKPYPVWARFVVMYETSLRPSTLSSLLWGDWRGATLVLREEDDKSRFGREVPISVVAQKALERLKPESEKRGLDVGSRAPIFGSHTYTKTLRKAARAAGLDGIAPYDLRHAKGTHMADAGAPLTGIAFVMGHKQMTTSNKYLHASGRAAELAIHGPLVGPIPGTCEEADMMQGDRRVSNPRQLDPQSTNALAITGTYQKPETAARRVGPPGYASNRVRDQESAPVFVDGFEPPKRASTTPALDGYTATCTECGHRCSGVRDGDACDMCGGSYALDRVTS